MSKFEEFLRKKNRAKRFNEVLNNLNPGAEILRNGMICIMMPAREMRKYLKAGILPVRASGSGWPGRRLDKCCCHL